MTVTACRYCRHFDSANCADAFNCFEPLPESEAPPESFKARKKPFVFEQLELLTVQPDYSRIKKDWPEQQPIETLPLFDLESQRTQQLSLFN